jgi:DNA-entry nuclease
MAMMVVSPNTITYEERESISDIRPVGFVQAKYACISDDGNAPGYVYNRMHLLMYHAGGPLRDVRNITTGTRFCNATLMLTYEDAVVDYVKETGNSVLYRVTPLYNEEELVPRAIQMEAYSMQDEGKGVCFNVLVWNVEPGITINYETGETTADNGEVSSYMGNQ